MVSFISFCSLLILVLCAVKPKYGLPLYIVYSLFFPYLQIGNLALVGRVAALLFLIFFFLNYRNKIKNVDYSPFKPFFFLYIAQFFLLFIQDPTYFPIGFDRWNTYVLTTITYALLIYTDVQTNYRGIIVYNNALLISSLIIILYGLFLTSIPGINPYQILISPLFGCEFNEAYALGDSYLSSSTSSLADGRLFGRISSVFSHPMLYGLNLGFFFVVVTYVLYERKKYRLLVLFEICLIAAVVTCGVRSAIAALVLTLIVGILNLKRTRLVIMSILAFLLVINILPMVSPAVNEYLLSMFDSSGNVVQGSSLKMRYNQFIGCFGVIQDCLFTGKGFEWTSDYLSKHEIHPVLLNFESLIFMIICNSGLLGLVIWGIFICMFFKFSRKIKNKNQQTAILCLFTYYIMYSLITGDYYYLKYFMLYYAVLVGGLSFKSNLYIYGTQYKKMLYR